MAAAAADGVVPTKGEEGPGGAESGGEEKKPLPEFSLGFLSQTNPVRAVAINWIRSKWFNQSIIGLIVWRPTSVEPVEPAGRSAGVGMGGESHRAAGSSQGRRRSPRKVMVITQKE